jgi:predicted nucleic acid-binding protein
MMYYVLDTDISIYWLNGKEGIRENVRRYGIERLRTTIITLAELKFGAYNSQRVQENLLLAQDVPEATLFRRSTGWQSEIYHEGTLHLASVNLDIPLEALYRRVRLQKGGDNNANYD